MKQTQPADLCCSWGLTRSLRSLHSCVGLKWGGNSFDGADRPTSSLCILMSFYSSGQWDKKEKASFDKIKPEL